MAIIRFDSLIDWINIYVIYLLELRSFMSNVANHSTLEQCAQELKKQAVNQTSVFHCEVFHVKGIRIENLESKSHLIRIFC